MDSVGRSPLIASKYDLYWHRSIPYRVLHNHRDRITLSRRHSRTHSLKAGVTPVYSSRISLRVSDIYICIQVINTRALYTYISVYVYKHGRCVCAPTFCRTIRHWFQSPEGLSQSKNSLHRFTIRLALVPAHAMH